AWALRDVRADADREATMPTVPRKRSIRCLCAALFTLVGGLLSPDYSGAQDTRYAPRAQQIPGPGCLVAHPPWEGGSTQCSDNTHKEWLADVTRWRAEKRIRVGYDPARYE